MSRIRIDWKAIRPLKGSQQAGFEELCAQLAREALPINSSFERKGAPDAGVECYAILENGAEWAWQAKYFDTLGDSQWAQLDQSVRTALNKHPKLSRYFVCVPLDRADARLSGRRSAKDRWDEHDAKWREWSRKRGMRVEFAYWGSHELLDILNHPRQVGRVRFWFDVRGFDQNWFNARLVEAIRTAGPRYTPELHVDLPIARAFDALGRTDRFFRDLKGTARPLRKALQALHYAKREQDAPGPAVALDAVLSSGNAVLEQLSGVVPSPIGSLRVQGIIDFTETALRQVEAAEQELLAHQKNAGAQQAAAADAGALARRANATRELRYPLNSVEHELRRVRSEVTDAVATATARLMILSGDAGTGKTHLLCDVASKRLSEGRPTVLLMGQQFIADEDPWTQALRQLDVGALAADEFVGALEAAAEAAGAKALVFVDAVNEGAGRRIWPSHASTFVARLEQSEWIGVAFSVRSSYERVLPAEIRERATRVVHEGFSEHEFDATKIFFRHYGLELPSTPLLVPEFRNPLFLKVLCEGLRATPERRLPRGGHGISATFDLFLRAVNDRLSGQLDFNPKSRLVWKALEAVVSAFGQSGDRWLAVDEAERLVDGLLPGRDHGRSLYRALVSEGLLLEQGGRAVGQQDVVQVGYERFADYLSANALLDAHLDTKSPEVAFASGGPLSFLRDKKNYIPSGLLEALCVQVAERTQREFSDLVPEAVERWEFAEAFRQSIVWRLPEAVTDRTRAVLNDLMRTDHDLHGTLEVLVTVATLPAHPLNAKFLDQRLRKDRMPDRDSWWSTYLYSAWGRQGGVERLIEWAWAISPDHDIDDETVELAATVLAWVLTTSHRPLRDRATQSLVNLLTGRLSVTARWVAAFADVDDPYVAERVFGVAYGVAMRSDDSAGLRELARTVYDNAFTNGPPRAHILLRDYARGVIERAAIRGAALGIPLEQVRPPYRSPWPHIPSEDEIKPLLPDWSKASHDGGDIEWARHSIGSSVMDGDFASYVIGTNSSATEFLSLRLDEPAWRSPDELLSQWTADLSPQELTVWVRYEAADAALAKAMPAIFIRAVEEANVSNGGKRKRTKPVKMVKGDTAIPKLRRARVAKWNALCAVLGAKNQGRLDAILAAREQLVGGRSAPRFDLKLIQRYILWRVFDLGWTTQRFGRFDRYTVGAGAGREAAKPERMGKKYQWIAYHEVLALVADNFQYREEFRETGAESHYDGPWQERIRDIDPSCTLRTTPGGTSWEGHRPAWWGATKYESWALDADHAAWVGRVDDLPRVEDVLRATHPDDKMSWVNLDGYFAWKQPTPPDQESTDVDRRELWLTCDAYLLKQGDSKAFLKWAQKVDFWGRWMPASPELYGMFLGEHVWSPAARHFERDVADEWVRPGHACPVEVLVPGLCYIRESGNADCSVDESYSLRLPGKRLIQGLGLRWTGRAACFSDTEGRDVVFDPTAHGEGPSALLCRVDALRRFLDREGLKVAWAVLGEKRVLGGGLSGKPQKATRMTGAFVWDGEQTTGFVRLIADDPFAKQTAESMTTIWSGTTRERKTSVGRAQMRPSKKISRGGKKKRRAPRPKRTRRPRRPN